MIRASFAAVPKRLPVLWAKASIALVLTTVLLCVPAAFAAFLIGQSILSKQHLDTTLAHPGTTRAVLGCALYLAGVGLLGLGLGALLRNTAAAISTLFGVLFVLPVVVRTLSGSWSGRDRGVPAEQRRSSIQPSSRPTQLGPWTGLHVVFLLLRRVRPARGGRPGPSGRVSRPTYTVYDGGRRRRRRLAINVITVAPAWRRCAGPGVGGHFLHETGGRRGWRPGRCPQRAGAARAGLRRRHHDARGREARALRPTPAVQGGAARRSRPRRPCAARRRVGRARRRHAPGPAGDRTARRRGGDGGRRRPVRRPRHRQRRGPAAAQGVGLRPPDPRRRTVPVGAPDRRHEGRHRRCRLDRCGGRHRCRAGRL